MSHAAFTGGPDLLERLALERVGATSFRGESGPGPARHGFGGQVAAHAVLAAGRTVGSDRPIRSLHAYFLAPTAVAPIEYEVELVRDGRSAAFRAVTAVQGDRTVFRLIASFQDVPDEDTHHHADAPDVPSPDALPVGLRAPMEVRPVEWAAPAGEPAAHQRVWTRCPVALPDDPLVHAAAVTYASDLTLGWSPWKSLGVHRVAGEMFGASVDHAMWFHRPVRADDWLLVDQRTQAVAGGRGLAIGQVFDAAGDLMVTTVQEGLMRGIASAVAASDDELAEDDDRFVIA